MSSPFQRSMRDSARLSEPHHTVVDVFFESYRTNPRIDLLEVLESNVHRIFHGSLLSYAHDHTHTPFSTNGEEAPLSWQF